MKKLTLILLIFCAFTSIAQDKIVKKTGDIIDCSVTEVGTEEIKYIYKDKPAVVFVIDKALVDKIEFSTGEVVKVETNNMNNPEYYANQNKRALKLNFLSPLMGYSEIVYEQNIKPGKSWEVSLGIIGLGLDPQDINPAGVYGKFAYKFIRTPDFYVQKMQYSHILKGAYFAPEIAFRYMHYDSHNYDYYYPYSSNESREEDMAIALMLKFGKQWVFDDSFLVDVFCGFGYGYSENAEDALRYGFIAGNGDVPIAGTAGLRVGWTF